MSKHCTNPNCKREIPDNSIFCSYCGSIQASEENLLKDVLNKIDLIYRQNQEILLNIKRGELSNTDNNSSPQDPQPQPTRPCHPFVDLGLSVYWSPYNLGASSEEEIGDYFSWAETEAKEEYNQDEYEYKKQKDISGDSHFDPASIMLNGGWRMPRKKEVRELLSKCKMVQCSSQEDDDVFGVLFTGPSGKSIFIPAGGYYEEGGLNHVGRDLWYWTSTPDPESPSTDSYVLNINDVDGSPHEISYEPGDYIYSNDRYWGLLIRPVLDK